MKFSKTLILISLLILIFIAIIYLQIFKKTSINKNNSLQINITSININSEPILVGQPIIINFNAPISIDSLKVVVSPKEELKLKLNDSLNELSIETISGIWKYNSSYTLDISGNILNKNYHYNFKTRPYSGI